jgi:hypothetical protein
MAAFRAGARTNGIQVSEKCLQGNAPLTIPAHAKVTVLLDQMCLPPLIRI